MHHRRRYRRPLASVRPVADLPIKPLHRFVLLRFHDLSRILLRHCVLAVVDAVRNRGHHIEHCLSFDLPDLNPA